MAIWSRKPTEKLFAPSGQWLLSKMSGRVIAIRHESELYRVLDTFIFWFFKKIKTRTDNNYRFKTSGCRGIIFAWWRNIRSSDCDSARIGIVSRPFRSSLYPIQNHFSILFEFALLIPKTRSDKRVVCLIARICNPCQHPTTKKCNTVTSNSFSVTLNGLWK